MTLRFVLRLLCAGMFGGTALDAYCACDFSGIDQRVQQLMTQDGISDGAVLVGSAQGVLHKAYFGTYSDSTVVPIASATKLLSGVRIMQLADQGVVSLDAPVSNYLSGVKYPWNVANDTGAITLRQMFSHTAGYGNDDDDPILGAPSITLQQSAQLIASNYMNYSPQDFLPAGSQFAYGGVSMQIGGAAAEAQSGVDWEQGWKSAIGTPLCVNTIDWQGLGTTQNYRIAGGAQTSLDDYARVLAMLLSDGVGNGTRILSPVAVATLNHSQTGSATVGFIPSAEATTQYGIGAWIEPIGASVDAPTISSIGKFGFTPWVDYSSGTFGIVMVNSTATIGGENPASVFSHAAMNDIITAIRDQLQANGGSCSLGAVYDNLFAAGFDSTSVAPSCPGIVNQP